MPNENIEEIRRSIASAATNSEKLGAYRLLIEELNSSLLFNESSMAADEYLAFARHVDNEAEVANALVLVVKSNAHAGNFGRALEAGPEAISKIERHNDKQKLGIVYERLAAASNSSGNLTLTAEYCEKAKSILDEIKDTRGLCNLLITRASLQIKYGDQEAAIAILHKALDLAAEQGYANIEASAAYGLGITSFNKGEYKHSREYCERAINLFRELNNGIRLGHTLINLSKVHLIQGEFDNAIDGVFEALEVFENVGYQPGIPDALTELAGIYRNKGNAELAIEYGERAVSHARQLNNVLALIPALVENGTGCETFGQYSKAMNCFKTVVELSKEHGFVFWEGMGLLNLAEIMLTVGLYFESLEYFAESIDRFNKVQYPTYLARAQGNMGELYAKLDDHHKALEFKLKALKVVEDSGDALLTYSIKVAVASEFEFLGEIDKAIDLVTESIEGASAIGYKEIVAEGLTYLGKLNVSRLELDQAYELFVQALSLSEELNRLPLSQQIMLCVAKLFVNKNFVQYNVDLSVEQFHKALTLAIGSNIKENIVEAHFHLSELYRLQEKWLNAHHHLSEYHTVKAQMQMEEARRLDLMNEHRKQIEEIEKRHVAERAEREAAELKAQLLEADLQRKQVELASSALNLAQQTENLSKFKTELNSIVNGHADVQEIVRQFRKKIKELPDESIDWPRFEAQFTQNFPDFLSRLVDKYPELTKMESRICTLLKLHLTSAEIAQILSLSERSIEWHRLNIRKKLGLERHTDIYETMKAI